ncbi:MAG: hypothetical protein H6Q16_1591 [Bacteroidetes bacterium]|nr:hypothetical protein [Bacteroidota bacterium]
MRVSKVKVGKEMVLMHRTDKEGALVLEESKKNITDKIKCNKKDSFHLSILNQTLVKKNRNKDLETIIYSVIKGGQLKLESDKQLSEIEIKNSLTNKFKEQFYYNNKEGSKMEFNLAALILKFYSTRDIKELQPYKDWVDWYIDFKSERLEKSIIVNKINFQTKRKETLKDFEQELIKTGKINISDIASLYGIEQLIKTFEGIMALYFMQVKKRDFHLNYKLKSALQIHQSKLFSIQSNRDNLKLGLFNIEVTKYFQHYFPIKVEDKRKTDDDVKYYLQEKVLINTISNQIENAVRSTLITKGKFKAHNIELDSINSEILTEIKIKDAFVLNLIDACAFAANNIRNIVDNGQVKDILGNEDFNYSLNKHNVNKELYKIFFDNEYKDINENLWALRGSVQQIRNKIYHYNVNSIADIFNICTYENQKYKNRPYLDTPFKEELKNEIENIPNLILSKFNKNNILKYYSDNDLNAIIEKLKFNLCRPSEMFIPSFKSVFDTARVLPNNHYLGVKNYFSKDNCINEEHYQACRFIAKQIYNYQFLNQSVDDNEFKIVVNEIIESCKNNVAKKNNINKYAFHEIEKMEETDTRVDYLKKIHSQIILSNANKDDKTEKSNFEKFLLYIYIKLFDNFIDQHYKDLIVLGYTYDVNNRVIEKDKIEVEKIKLIEDNDNTAKIVPFYIFCKLLDSNHLSNLRNEIIKYNAISKKNDSTSNRLESSLPIDNLLFIIEMCLLSVDNSYGKPNETYKKFIVDRINTDNLYSAQDNETLILHSNIELLNKYGTISILEKLISHEGSIFKVTQQDYNIWEEKRENIEGKQKEIIELHNKWSQVQEKLKGLKKEEKEKRKKIRKEESDIKDKYKCIVTEVTSFNQLDNKLHFVALRKLHNLTIEILGRFVGFTNMFERDFQYLNDELNSNMKFDKGLPNNIPNEYNKFFLSVNYRDIRNYIAHFNYISNKSIKYSMIDIINELRELLWYDRKLKNAVAKSIIDIFDRNGMELKLKFSITEHKLDIDYIKPKKIYHLGTKKGKFEKDEITTNQVSEEYCKMCEALLVMKK